MRLLIHLIILLAVQTSGSSLFRWGGAVEVGFLDPAINEASGLAISSRYPNRLYHINDSGDTGRFLVTDATGAHAQSVRVTGFKPVDVEDLAIGPCGQPTDCLFLADTGDNNRKRSQIEIVVVQERMDYPDSVPALARIRLRYPDRAHDAESLAVHPDGTLYLLTKEPTGRNNRGEPNAPSLFKLPAQRWQKQPGALQTLEHVMDFDLTKLIPISAAPPSARLPTSMDISRDGKRVLILAYIDALELAIDLSQPIPTLDGWREGWEYQRIPLTNLEQQEAVGYMPDGNAFLYNTEARRSSASRQRMIRMQRLQ